LTFDPSDYRIAYVTYSTFGGSHVWRSFDAGVSWAAIDGAGAGALPDIPIHCIVINPNNTANLYLGTDLGVFVSQNGGASWAIENSGFPNTVVESLALNTTNGQTSLYAFTHGRGVWRVSISASGCSYSLSATGQQFGVDGDTGSVKVTTTPGNCGWTATSNSDWVVITAGGNGVGPVQFTVAPNSGITPRAGTLTIAGRSFTVTQPGRMDVIPPNIQITSPTTNGRFNTASATITISGLAHDNQGVVRIVGNSDRAFGVSVTGLNNWTTSALPLQIGANVFSFTAFDVSGNNATATIQVNYMPSQSSNGLPVILTVAGTDTFFTRGGYAGDGGPANAARLNYPRGLIFDPSGNLYVSDVNNSRVRKIDTAGIITTVVGNGRRDTSGVGGPATAASLYDPNGLALDKAGNLYIAQVGGIRKVTPNGVISTFIELPDHYTPGAMTIDRNDNLYLVDHAKNRVQKISPDKTVTTIAGTGQGGYSGDGGPATQAQLLVQSIGGIAVDDAGNIYIADGGNHRIRKIGTNNLIRTIAGNGEPGYNGDNIPAAQATLFFPEGVSVDGIGNIYIAESNGHRVRKIKPDGIITAVAGNGAFGSGGDGGSATSAQLWGPTRAISDQAGNVYIADSANHRIRRTVPFIGEDAISPVVKITSPTTTGSYLSTMPAIRLMGTSSDNVQVTHITWRNSRGGGGIVRGTNDWTTQLNPFEPAVNDIPLASGHNLITVTAWDIAGNNSSTTLAVTYNPPNVLAVFAGRMIAQLNSPEVTAFDIAGNLYIADTGNHSIRKVTRYGTINTIDGNVQLG
jgi:sugar lactone lactonase YvrE